MSHIHNMLDSDPIFSIDSTTREITYLTEYDEFPILVQGDHNSQHFTFELPRYIDGHDMTLCNKVFVNYINISAENTSIYNTGKYEIIDLKPDPEDEENYVRCTWVVSGGATSLVGNLSFMVRFTCVTDTTLDYAWNTGTYNNVTIVSAITDDSVFEQEYTDILQVWRYELIEAGDSSLAAIEIAKKDAISAIGDAGGIMVSETEPTEEKVVAWVVDMPEEEQESFDIVTKEDINPPKSSNEFDDSKLPSKIYYKVLDPEWVNTLAIVDKSKSYEVADVKYAEEDVKISAYLNHETSDSQYITVPKGIYYTECRWEEWHMNSEESFSNVTPLAIATTNNTLTLFDENNKKIEVSTVYRDGYEAGCDGGVYVTTYTYEDGSPVTAPLTLYPTNEVTCYDFENLQFTTESEGNTLLGDVYTYLNEWNGRNYTLYPDYTPNIAEGQSAISLAISDPENMLYSIKLEALFNGGYTFSLGNKNFAYLGGVDVVADGVGASASGRKTFVIGNGASGFGVLNKIRARNATAFGYNNTVTGTNGAAFNEGNKILAYAATGLGDHNTVGGSYDIIGGLQNKSKGHANLGQGTKNVIDGNYILGLGNLNVVKGICNIMQGYRNEIDGKYNDMNGFDNKIKGNSNIVNGNNNTISSSYNKVFGTQNTIIETSTFNVINGQNNEINAPSSVDNLIVGIGNIVEPSPYAGTKNYGYNVLVGRYNISKSTYGIAYGAGLVVDGTSPQLVLGSYNEVDRYASIIIGNGSSDTKRSNSVVVKRDGRAVLGADPKENMDAVTKQYLDKALKNYVGNDMISDIESALDTIIQIQNGIIGGETL